MLSNASKHKLLEIAQEWRHWQDTTVEEMLNSKAVKESPEDYDIEDLDKIIHKFREEHLNRLRGAIEMANTVYDRYEVFETLKEFLGVYMLRATAIYDMSQF